MSVKNSVALLVNGTQPCVSMQAFHAVTREVYFGETVDGSLHWST